MKAIAVAVGVSATLGMALLVGGCGSSSSSSASGSSSSSGSTSAAAQAAYFDQQLAHWFKGDSTAPPTTGPRPTPGKSVWIISCGQSNNTCARTVAFAQQAGNVLGWHTTVCDSKGDPAVATTCIQNAIAAKAAGIYVYYQDCDRIKQAVVNARRANIPVVASEGFDCNYNNPGQKSEYNWVVRYVEGDNAAWARAYGQAQADVVIAKMKEKAVSLFVNDDSSSDRNLIIDGWNAEFAKCSACKSYVIVIPFASIGTDLQQRTEQELLKHPDVNSIGVEYDAISVGGVAAGAKASGRKLFVMAGEGSPASGALIRSGGLGAGVGDPLDWEAWSAMDSMNRLFNGQKPAPCGCGLQAFDLQHNLFPEGSGYVSPVNFRADFKKAWGLG